MAEPDKPESRSGDPAKRGTGGEGSGRTGPLDRRTPVKPKRIGNRWAAPAMIACAVIGLIWIVLFYAAGTSIPVMQDLGSWNLLIGMGFIVAAFGFAMKWE